MADVNAPSTQRKWLSTTLWMLAFFAIAFALRSAFSVDEGFDSGSDRHIFTGNDPYYHWRTVTHVVETGKTLEFDWAINYPEGNWNPNPPLWTWTTAPLAALLEGSVADPVGLALNLMVAFWGALTIIPVYMVGNAVWGRRAGLWAAFLIAVSAPHIQRSVWGYADHDAISMFFIVLAFAFLVKALQAVRARNFVSSWRDGGAIGRGLREAVASNRNALVYAALAAVAITACALVWKGYPYALAVLAFAVGFQLFVDHIRNRDTTAVFLVYLTVVALSVALPWLLYYANYANFIGQTVGPSMYVLIGVLLAGLILVPTRDLPSIVVFPTLLVALVAGVAVLMLALPEVWFKITSGLGYFSQSKLYSTIAEAQRPRLGVVAANFGFFTFLLAFWGFGRTLRGLYKGDAPELLMAAWAGVAMFMTFAASRFIMNAAPVFALLTGYALARLVEVMLGSGELQRRFRSSHGQNIASRTVSAMDWKVVVGGLLMALLVILPNAWAGVDAGMSSEYEASHDLVDYTRDPETGRFERVPRFGAFGITFDLKDNGWNDVMRHLATLDTGVPIEDKPGFIAWWDYGHWATGIGQHPSVADPFQSHYELAGRFLASDSEEEAVSWLTIHLINGDARMHGGSLGPEVRQYLEANAPALLAMPLGYGNYDASYRAYRGNVTGDQVYRLFEGLQDRMGKRIGYMGVDDRMYPYDSPQTPGVDRQSIFYAPVYLANKNPDDYLQFQFQSGSTTITMQRYGVDAQGNSFELEKPRYVDASGRNWTEYQGYVYPEGQTPLQGFPATGGVPLFQGESMRVMPKFHTTLFANAFGGITTDSPAGDTLRHWRLLTQSTSPGGGGFELRRVALLAYYSGVVVNGTVQDEAGAPLVGYGVTFVDGNGARHDLATTDGQGRFSVIAPFAVDNDLRLEVRGQGDGATLFSDNRTEFQFSREEATRGKVLTGIEVRVQRGGVAGRVYVDQDGDGKLGGNDTVVGGAQVSAGEARDITTDAGNYTLSQLQPGTYTVAVNATGYDMRTASVTIRAAESSSLDIAVTPTPSRTTVRFVDGDGAGLEGFTVRAEGPGGPDSATTNATGHATFDLAPGTHVLTVDANRTGADGQVERTTARQTVTVPFGGDPLDVTLTRDET